MGFRLLTDDKGCVVYRKDKVSAAGNKYTTYSTKISSKNDKDEWESAFIELRFRKGVELNNKAKINIKSSFPTLNTYNEKTTVRWMIMEFDVLEEGEKPSDPVSLDDEFMTIPDDIDDVPFA